MNTLKKHWFLILLILLMLYALYTANRLLAIIVAVFLFFWNLFHSKGKMNGIGQSVKANSFSWLAAGLAALIALLWGSDFAQSLYTRITGQPAVPQPNING